ncbi:hypothetical protein VI817_003581 [Penicillium citrinum]|nr:hypothetical protein VI817_003581 [Penicillium citrinum]
MLLALDTIQNQQRMSISQAAKTFSLACLHFTCQNESHKLTDIEEDPFEKWILDLDKRGVAHKQDMVRDMANILLSKRGDSTIYTVGKNWELENGNFFNLENKYRMYQSSWCAISPTVIFKDKILNYSLFNIAPDGKQFEVSSNGWTADEFGLV